jgi:hypothetical protein
MSSVTAIRRESVLTYVAANGDIAEATRRQQSIQIDLLETEMVADSMKGGIGDFSKLIPWPQSLLRFLGRIEREEFVTYLS